MNPALHRVNLVLLALLGGLCVFQWRGENDTRRFLIELHKTADLQEQKLQEQSEALHRSTQDLDGFRSEVASLHQQVEEQNIQIRQQKASVFTLEQEKGRSDKQIAVLRQSLDAYKTAVASRDENIKTLLDQREQLYSANKNAVEKANQSIFAFNDLSARYGDLVKQYNELVTRYKAEHPDTGVKTSS